MHLLTTRFDESTWRENQEYRLKHNIPCIYGSPLRITEKIREGDIICMIEMNNSLNRIEGFGIIKNTLRMDKYFKVYDKGNYNRYVYKGFYYIDRDTIINENRELVEWLDIILFKGKSHMKRGGGFSKIPDKLVSKSILNNIDLKQNIQDLFIKIKRLDENQKKE